MRIAPDEPQAHALWGVIFLCCASHFRRCMWHAHATEIESFCLSGGIRSAQGPPAHCLFSLVVFFNSLETLLPSQCTASTCRWGEMFSLSFPGLIWVSDTKRKQSCVLKNVSNFFLKTRVYSEFSGFLFSILWLTHCERPH